VKKAVERSGKTAAYSGDIGCYTLGNAMGLTDTCLCMGAGLTQAAGIHRAEPDLLNIAFIGDSTFFAAGVTGLVNAVYNGADELVCILDNSTTAMTGGQQHPGMGATILGKPAPKVDIYALVKAAGVTEAYKVNAYDSASAAEALDKCVAASGVRVIIFEGPCVQIKKEAKHA
jgi:indolepyruvate ferredoxin oxidoreductase alpha subunit